MHNLTKFLLFLLSIIILIACVSADKKENVLSLSDEVNIQEIHDLYRKGTTVKEVTKFYIDRIERMNNNGPNLNAILSVNPHALSIAEGLDTLSQNEIREKPLYGIPILLKDNIDTGDGMPCTAGARAMKNSTPEKDSPLATQLREAGAIILGKANLSEWANFHSNQSSSGWSGLGGQTNNPYDLTRNPCGSSAGSGVAVAANLSVLAIGTETNGSIVCPSSTNGIVGIKPTVGLVSRSGIIPISHTQDTGGPMARTVTDAVICLGTLTSQDISDPSTLTQGRKASDDYTSSLKKDGLKDKRIGYFKSNAGENPYVMSVLEQAVEEMKKGGAEIVDIEEIMDRSAGSASYQVLLYEFKHGLNKYFSNHPDCPVKNLDDLIKKTFADSIEMAYHDHQLLKIANEKGPLTDKEYLEAKEKAKRLSQEEGIDKVMDENNLDAIIAPAGGPAWKTDPIAGDNYGIYSSSPAAIAGYPNICVPMGKVHGLPVGLNIFGRKWSEAILIEIAYAYEQETKHRSTPLYLNGNK